MSKIKSIQRLGSTFAIASGLFVANAQYSASKADNCQIVQRGEASWYGKDFERPGRVMANGKRFNRFASTVAHKTLAKGTNVKIERQTKDGRILDVRAVVTDRGPYKGGRIVDVSEGLANKLEMRKAGVSTVTLMKCD